jgi:CBS domain-containing protein
MTHPVVAVQTRSTLEQALWTMTEYEYRRLPVLEDLNVVGMIVQHDIERALRLPGVVLQTPVKWVMTSRVITVSPDDDLATAARIVRNRQVSALPVLAQERLVGIITERDLLDVLIILLEEN